MGRAGANAVEMHILEMHMPKRQHDLQRQRRQREQSAVPFMAMNPSHPPMLTL